MNKAIYINPTQHYEAIVAGEPQALVSIGLWTGHKSQSVTLSFETTQGEEPNDTSRFTVATVDGRALLEALQRLLA